MKFIDQPLGGLYEFEYPCFSDERGVFAKPFHSESLFELGLNSDFKEFFFSDSNKDVLRGMHFQLPPHGHDKLVFVSSGCVLDVVLDIRHSSPTFGEFVSFELFENDQRCLYISSGFAHGFLSLEDNSRINYLVTSLHSPTHDTGVRWDSFNFNWPVSSPIISPRDSDLLTLEDFGKLNDIDWHTNL